ncbi:enoyl-coa delta isomerase 3-like [Plakobranchus ocellatus]|uniref:Enoyl-coa delta isomerase 3-like n=1 Tax=Plakobranchus ocellatus TaxID=259542 RepID=A0AAV4DQY3_9GAST|nr:enoyl-coa delta isomerase 3-like [Plakobranchus ocellatus]
MSVKDSSHLHKPVKDLGTVALFYAGDIAVIVMDAGENRMNTVFTDKLSELLDEVEGNTSCKGLITTAEGKFYSNGLDLERLQQYSTEQHKEFFKKLGALLMRLLLFPVPTLAAINGHAFAGGALLAIAHDLRTQRYDKGWLCFNEVFINRQFLNFHYPLMRTKIGSGINYTDAVTLGQKYTGSKSLEKGLIHAAPSASLLLPESLQLLKSFSGKSGYPRESLRLMKADVYGDVIEQYKLDLENIDEMVNKFMRASKL